MTPGNTERQISMQNTTRLGSDSWNASQARKTQCHQKICQRQLKLSLVSQSIPVQPRTACCTTSWAGAVLNGSPCRAESGCDLLAHFINQQRLTSLLAALALPQARRYADHCGQCHNCTKAGHFAHIAH